MRLCVQCVHDFQIQNSVNGQLVDLLHVSYHKYVRLKTNMPHEIKTGIRIALYSAWHEVRNQQINN